MKTRKTHSRFIGLCASAMVLLFALRAAGNPIELPEKSATPQRSFLIAAAILVEVFCIWGVLRHSQKPRFFPVWVVGMHLLTYPAFLGLLLLLQDIRPAFAIVIGECIVVLVEGGLIFLICRLMRPAKPELPSASATKCFLASFVGNVCSAGTFPIFVAIFDRFAT